MTHYKRRRSVKSRPHRRHQSTLPRRTSNFFSSYRGKQIIGYALLGLILTILAPLSRPPIDLSRLDNGDGGPGWKIGEVQLENWGLSKERLPSEVNVYALELVNRDRQLNGVSPLIEDPLLSVAAQRHAEDMLIRQFYDHINPDGHNPSDRFKAVGGQTGAGENISKWDQNGAAYAYLAYGLVEKLQNGWMYSDGHRANLLNPGYKTFGYGIVISKDGQEMYAVQLFSF